jgi:hypothetical protein
MYVVLFRTCSHVIIKTRNVDPRAKERILIKEIDRDVSSQRKGLTNTNLFKSMEKCDKVCNSMINHETDA